MERPKPLTRDLKVAIVAGDPLARAGLAVLLGQEPDMDIVGQFADAEGLARAIGDATIDVIALDAGWDTEAALDAMRGLGSDSLPVLTMLPDDSHASVALAAGARAILIRDSSIDEIVAALRAIVEGLTVIDSRAADAVLAAPERIASDAAPELTPRELQVLRLVAEGFSNKEIAFDLDISGHTVKFHVNSILSKLAARSRTEAVTNAARSGLLYL